jgi:hypothetical protein
MSPKVIVTERFKHPYFKDGYSLAFWIKLTDDTETYRYAS